jgi:predicted RNase H-like HicB family nuclease
MWRIAAMGTARSWDSRLATSYGCGPWLDCPAIYPAGVRAYTVSMRQVVLYPDLEDGGWVVEVPSLPGCVSEGDTREQAIENVRDAIEEWISAARQVGMTIPDETFEVQVCVV